jgi:hypothetical protein
MIFSGRKPGEALDAPKCKPGELAQETGWYQLLNMFGTPTAVRIFIEHGTPAPAAPRGHMWRLVSQD